MFRSRNVLFYYTITYSARKSLLSSIQLRMRLSKVSIEVLMLIFTLNIFAVLGTSSCMENKRREDVNYIGYGQSKQTSNKVTPIILVPGDGGSQIQAKLNKPETAHYYCEKKTTEYFTLWLNLELLIPYVLHCWVDNMRLVYNNYTRTTTNSPGVDIIIPGFGNTDTVEWLDPSHVSPSAYFTNIVEYVLPLGYTRGVNIQGAPYDFRKAPNEMQDYLKNVTNLLEDTYYKTGNKKVLLICHSLGCPVMLYMLNKQPQSWKDKHVKGLVSLGAPWGGVVKALKAFASGENLGVFVINPLIVRKEQRSCPSLAYLIPSDKFWSKNEILVFTAKKNYTVANYYEFFQDINFETGWEMWKDTRNLTYEMKPPGVEVHCLHGFNVSTIESFSYAEDEFPDGQPTITYGNGDGTVNLRSLLGCLRWKMKQKHKVYHKVFMNVDHMSILHDPIVLEYIKNLII
ncbi:lysosomal phospholipase A and acyltransferase-like isoform X1 [Tachypleus tridentatus]|uniref:lysosomal phospholipase A and acyltransferase-like isoform X1 n=1 Tax=Tachypleus tridentatus TaxID=6853 RepID=UPI003FCF6E9E